MLQSKWVFVTALLTFPLVDVAHGTTCTDLKDPKVRTFADLSKYQGNHIPFDPMNSESAGNYVQIDKVKSNLEKNDFISYQSENIIKLYLSGKGIKTIESQAFNQLNCLRYLNLDGNRLTELSEDIFDELKSMAHLNLSGNSLDNLPDDLFGAMHGLIDLDLSRNKIKSLRKRLFENQTNLQHLDLSHNQLNFLHLEDFKFLGALTKVDVSFNVIYSIEFPTTFVFPSLSKVFLNDNQLKDLNVFSMRNKMPHLSLLKIDNNPFACDDLAYILRALDDTRVIYEGKNKTTNNLVGIDCTDFTEYIPMSVPTKQANFNNDKLMEKVHVMMIEITQTRNLMIWLIVLFCLTLTGIMLQHTMGPCKHLISRLPLPTNSDSSVENLRLIP